MVAVRGNPQCGENEWGWAVSSDGWGSPEPTNGLESQSDWDGWSGTQTGSIAGDDGWGGFDDDGFQPLKATSMTPLWIAMGCASMGAILGLYELVTTDFARAVFFGTTVAVVALGWLLSGLLAVAAMAVYQRQDLRKATSAFYAPNPAAASLRIAVVVTGAIGVVVNSYVFATWLGRH